MMLRKNEILPHVDVRGSVPIIGSVGAERRREVLPLYSRALAGAEVGWWG